MAMNVDVDSATRYTGKVESAVLSVPVKTPMINQISDVVWAGPDAGAHSVAAKMDILPPKSDTKQPAIVASRAAASSMPIRTTACNSMRLAGNPRPTSSLPSVPRGTYGPLPGTPGRCEGLYPLFESHADQFGIDRNESASSVAVPATSQPWPRRPTARRPCNQRR